jgi:flavin-dependent dehydrogenase
MSFVWDVAIIGGGPAGSASAISLRQTFPSLRALLLESSDYARPRAGEVLPPVARNILAHLGVLSLMTAPVATDSLGLACVWGSGHLDETSYFYGMGGEGWHLERNRFDAMLAMRAEALGATVKRNTALQSSRRIGNLWQLQLNNGQLVDARFVIDATGRSATFARGNGACRQPHDALMAFSRVFHHDDVVEARMVVEACAHGWWYTASLPGRRRVVSLLTDADLGRQLRLSSEEHWQHELLTTTHVRTLLEGASLQPGILVRSAATVALNHIAGDGWLAVGDAASAFDPLSAQGITSALRSGILAGFAAGDILNGDHVHAIARYAKIIETQRSISLRSYREHYARERRWSDQPFWARRQHQPVPSQALDVAVQGTM